MYVYFDHNVLIDANHARLEGNWGVWHELQSKLARLSARVVLSAWHMVENAKARDNQERRAYSAMITELQPLFLSNNNFVKQNELVRYLFNAGAWIENGEDRLPFHDSLAGMWTTYGGPVFIGEQFGEFVEQLVTDPQLRARIMTPLAEALALVKGAREAIQEDPGLIGAEAIVNREWLFDHLPERDRQGQFIPLAYRESAARFAAESIGQVLESCPTILADDLRYRNALLTNNRIDANDAADTQHVILPVVHCDLIVTRDRRLRRFINEAGLRCKAVESLDAV
ncbi:hypothetical protein [Herbaspirillum sp. YR522]|uniref:hypothetical protein n=1 Tax=Herbaspirillum sp. YR522 TaxID=1144342 RepID=UPI00026F4B28|nr:hypothetical protein [Herbaspirillum sp. YR522]EJM97469.1 hypothetical protein PMI40_04351 [Herbaspirillum sp. YR522]